MTLPGQTGIRLREALACGDWRAAAAEVPSLDEAHRVEILLGAALRDARGDWAAARAWLAAEAGHADWSEICRALAEGTPDHALDELASAWVAAGRAPDRWLPTGAPVGEGTRAALVAAEADIVVAAALAAGVSGAALLEALVVARPGPLADAVAHYYRRGTIHALGVRPLLVLAAS